MFDDVFHILLTSEVHKLAITWPCSIPGKRRIVKSVDRLITVNKARFTAIQIANFGILVGIVMQKMLINPE